MTSPMKSDAEVATSAYDKIINFYLLIVRMITAVELCDSYVSR